jgi:hypothetical protein
MSRWQAAAWWVSDNSLGWVMRRVIRAIMPHKIMASWLAGRN